MKLRLSKKFTFLTLLTLGLALIGGGYFPFYLFYSLLILIVSHCFYFILISHYLSIDVEFKNNVYYAGDCAKCTTIIKCSLPVPYIETYTSSFDYSQAPYTCQLGSITLDKNEWIENEVQFGERGFYNLGKVSLKAYDYLKIVELKKSSDKQVWVKVYPKTYLLTDFTSQGKDIYRENFDINSNIENPSNIEEIRKYRPGDSLKKIHWKLSAKHEILFIKKFEKISGQGVSIFADLHQDNYQYGSRGIIEEMLIDYLTSLANHMQKRDISTNVYLNIKKNYSFEIQGKESLNQFIEFLVTQKSDGQLDFSQFIHKNIDRIDRMNKIAILSLRINSRLFENLIQLKKWGYNTAFFYCLDEHETQITELNKWGIQTFLFKNLINHEWSKLENQHERKTTAIYE